MAESPDLPSTSMTSVDSPTRAAARAIAALTTVLPTPPVPATMTSRDAPKNRAGSKNSLPGRADAAEATQGPHTARTPAVAGDRADRGRRAAGRRPAGPGR